MSQSRYELPANGELRTKNSFIAAALNAIGVGGSIQTTEHVMDNGKVFASFNLEQESSTFPGVKTTELIAGLQQRKINMAGPWDEPTKLFLAGWIALTSRATFLEVANTTTPEDLQLIRTGEGICSLEPARQGNIGDLRRLAREEAYATEFIQSKMLMLALCTVGFAPVRFGDERGFQMTSYSLTFPGLSIALCVAAFREIIEYNRALSDCTLIIQPPKCDLPGAREGFHPFQFAVQSLKNYQHIMDICLPKTSKTLFFRNQQNSTRTAIVNEQADRDTIDAAVKHALRK